MKVYYQRILFWLRVVSCISLVNIANAPELKRLLVPPVCIGEDLQLRWEYDVSSATAGSIVWSFKQAGQDNVEIMLASMDVANWTFQIDPDVASRYANRLSSTKVFGYASGIQLLYVSEIDEGSYGIDVQLYKPTYYQDIDDVVVTLVNVTSYVIIPSDSNTVCCNESSLASLSWNVTNPGHPADGELCKTPTWAELRKDGKVIVQKQRVNATWEDVVSNVDLNGRVTFNLTSPFDIRIESTKLTDSGIYTLIVRYGNFSITSDEIKLQVSIPMSISQVADIRQCVGTDVSFPWKFDPGTDCENEIPPVSSISWERQSSADVDSSIVVANSTPFVPLDPRITQHESNAGIVVHNVTRSYAGIYVVSVKFKNISLTAITNLTVERRLTPTIVSGSPRKLEMCEGESFSFNSTFEYPDKNGCPYAKVIGRTWYLNDKPILTDDGDRATSEEPPSPVTPPNTMITHPQDSSDLEETTKGSSARRVQTDSPTFSVDRRFNAGLAVRNVTAKDSGNYYVNVTFNASDEIVQVLSQDYNTLDVKKVPNRLIPSDSKDIICFTESKSTSLSWNVSNPYHPEEKVCNTPTWIEWRKDGRVIVKKERINFNWVTVDFVVDLDNRLSFRWGFPLAIDIEPALITDAGNYTVTAGYGNISITSDEIDLQVLVPMRLSHLSVPQVCIGEKLSLPWKYNISSETVGNITWTFEQSKQDGDEITLATVDIAKGKFIIDPEAMHRYEGRLSHWRESCSPAGITISNVEEDDAGVYRIRILIDKPKHYSDTDAVNVSLVDVTANFIEPFDGKDFTCSVESNRTLLSWKVSNPYLSDDSVCKSPTLVEWSTEGRIIAKRQKFDGNWLTIHSDVDLNSRLSFRSGLPLDIMIDPTLVTDAGNYTVTAGYGNISIASEEIYLQVSIPMNISQVADFRQYVGTNASFPWEFEPGTDCRNKTNAVHYVDWKKVSQEPSSLATLVYSQDGDSFIPHDPRVTQQQSSAGIIIHNVTESDAGMYEVIVMFRNGLNLTATTKLVVEPPKIPILEHLSVHPVCIGEDLQLPWTYDFSEATAGNITWTFEQSEQDGDEMTLATVDVAQGKFIIDPDAMHRYEDRLSPLGETYSPAGIAISNVDEDDAGVYRIRILIDKPKHYSGTDAVNVSIVNVTSNVIVASDRKDVICSLQSKSASLSWTVENPHLPNEEACSTPDWREWRKDGRVIVERYTVDDNSSSVVNPDGDLNNRLSFRWGFPLDIVIEPTKLTDAGNYTVTVRYGNISITSDEIYLHVSIPMTIVSGSPPVVEMCEGESFAFNWTFEYPEHDLCPYNVKVIGRSWYLNETIIISDYDVPTTSDESSPPTMIKDSDDTITHTHNSPDPESISTHSEVTGSGEDITNGKTIPILTSESPTTSTEDSSDSESGGSGDHSGESGSGKDTTVGRKTSITTNSSTSPKDVSKASVTSTDYGTSARRGRRVVADQADSRILSVDRRFDAGLAFRNVKSEHSGLYHVEITVEIFTEIVNISSQNFTMLVVNKSPDVSRHENDPDHQTDEHCTNAILHLNWDLELNGCSRPFIISWYLHHYNQTEEQIGFSEDGRVNMMKNFAKRVSVANRTSLDIRNLTTDDSGTYVVRLTYPTDPSAVGRQRENLDGAVFTESSIVVALVVCNSGLDHRDAAEVESMDKYDGRDGDGEKSKSLVVKQCALSVLTAAMFGVLALQQQRP